MQGGDGVPCPMTWVFFWLIVRPKRSQASENLSIIYIVSGARLADEISWLNHLVLVLVRNLDTFSEKKKGSMDPVQNGGEGGGGGSMTRARLFKRRLTLIPG